MDGKGHGDNDADLHCAVRFYPLRPPLRGWEGAWMCFDPLEAIICLRSQNAIPRACEEDFSIAGMEAFCTMRRYGRMPGLSTSPAPFSARIQPELAFR
jgi:hypothetical protein